MGAGSPLPPPVIATYTFWVVELLETLYAKQPPFKKAACNSMLCVLSRAFHPCFGVGQNACILHDKLIYPHKHLKMGDLVI